MPESRDQRPSSPLPVALLTGLVEPIGEATKAQRDDRQTQFYGRQ